MPRTRITQIDRDHLINAYEARRDYIELDDMLGVNERTAYNIVLVFKRTSRRHSLPSGAPPPRKMTSTMLDFIISVIEEKPTMTLESSTGEVS